MQYIFSLILVVTLAWAVPVIAEDAPRILLLTRSAGFEHSVIKHDDDGSSHVERILAPLVEDMGGVLTMTKDASVINETSLRDFDLVIFYTSGDLNEEGGDGHPVMPDDGLEALFSWIRGGGGFLGFHSATDSFKSKGAEPGAFIQMVGAEFVKHGAQFEGAIKNVSPGHPAIASLPERWSLQDEWYLFKHFNRDDLHVLALLEIGEERSKQRMYNIPDYPMIWCRAFGDGRVLYNGMGHREDVWEHPAFKTLVVEHIRWALGEGPLQADPNFALVVPETKPDEGR